MRDSVGVRERRSPMSTSIVEQHLARRWPARRITRHRWPFPPALSYLEQIEVLCVRPENRRTVAVYVSDCAQSTEFCLFAREVEDLHIETLSMVANMHADPRYPMELGKVIEIGRPWARRSTCDHLLVSLPYPYGPEFEWVKTADRVVRIRGRSRARARRRGARGRARAGARRHLRHQAQVGGVRVTEFRRLA